MPPWEKYQSAPAPGPWEKYAEPEATPTAEAPTPEPASLADKMVGGWGGRTLLGMASPLIAAAQMVGGEGTRDKIAELDAMKKRGMAAEGKEGFDWYGLFGAMAPAAGIAKGVSAVLPAAQSIAGRVGTGAVLGGAGAAATPVEPSNEFWTDKAKQVGVGASVGAAIPLAAQAGMAAKAAVEPFYEKGREAIVGRTLRTAAGSDADNVANTLMQAREMVPGSVPTVAQAGGNVGLSSLDRAARAVLPEADMLTKARMEAQNLARVEALKTVSGDANKLEASRQAREAATGPMRQQALSQANVAGMEVPKLNAVINDKQKAIADILARRALANPQTPPAPTDALKSAVDLHGYQPPVTPALTAAQKAALEHGEESVQKGFQQITAAQAAKAALPKPLEATDITKRIEGIASQPGLRASDVVSKSLAAIKEKISSIANKDGIVDANDLYMVRKEAGNVIAKYAEESKNFDQRLTAGLIKDVQGYVDDAIEKAGGAGWRDYLSKYGELSKPINQMKVGQAIYDKSVDKMTNQLSPHAYGNALTDKTAQAATKYKQASLDEVMTPGQMQTLQSVKDDLARALRSQNDAGTVGSDTVKKMAYTNLMDRSGVPTFLREFAPTQVIGNIMARGADTVYKRGNEAIQSKLAETLLSTKEAARLMQSAGPSRYAAIIDELMKQGAVAGGTAAGRQQGATK